MYIQQRNVEILQVSRYYYTASTVYCLWSYRKAQRNIISYRHIRCYMSCREASTYVVFWLLTSHAMQAKRKVSTYISSYTYNILYNKLSYSTLPYLRSFKESRNRFRKPGYTLVHRLAESIPGLLKRLQIRALYMNLCSPNFLCLQGLGTCGSCIFFRYIYICKILAELFCLCPSEFFRLQF